MRWAEITLEVVPLLVEPASAALTGMGCSGVVVRDPGARSSDPYAEWVVQDQLSEDSSTKPEARCAVSGYLPVDDGLEPAIEDLYRRLALLQEAGLEISQEISLRMVDEESWADAWKAYFKPLRVGRRFVIKPSWEEWASAPDDLIVEIDPGMAFGSGGHPTTRLCLRLLEETLTPGERVLDWGTGSGILAIGAARLGAADITAIDLDPLAARIAGENAARNGFAGVIRAAAGSIEDLPLQPAFDRVLANIVADPIIRGAREIRKRLQPGGQAIISGIIEQREAEVAAALRRAGMVLVRTLHEEEWRALLLQVR